MTILFLIAICFFTLVSSLTALLDASYQWYTDIENGLVNGILFIDLKKAFDTIDHNIEKKILCYGTRTQKCSLQCGVPQRAILGRLLFLIYIYDLPDRNLMSDCRVFADDTNLT
jgi:hypothetical protein